MPSLYHSVVDVPTHIPQFNCHTLHQTQMLLKGQHPQLSDKICQLLADLAPADITPQYVAQASLDHFTVLNNLGAITIGKIIEALTQLGNHWLTIQPNDANSLAKLQSILQQWIELGDWLVRQSSAS
ncbi:hypothetical protein QWI17_06200 [Gilvimarinus sp. SDUM040013]|uniref:Uncharacterized protein n=1 Tax=Gilvimarinus gilvus TaxID=3058038 RepID=A0ABU4S2C7_9GAMM|nr:hypothetical protein [Gilvimarinus sp. SDUM040013]MDO3385429.1 hypothetical protein [Gilvimarinus sp. SDUM040013]MDX6851310.1 hypothetical protein [Gilvimarinus sp. SDUM040013]